MGEMTFLHVFLVGLAAHRASAEGAPQCRSDIIDPLCPGSAGSSYIQRRTATTQGDMASNEDERIPEVVCSVLFLVGGMPLDECWGIVDDDKRNTLISKVQRHCSDNVHDIQAKDNDYIAGSFVIQYMLMGAAERSSEQLVSMSLDDQRNTIIVVNADRLQLSVPQLQAESNLGLAQLAYGWYLESSSVLGPFIHAFSSVTAAHSHFDVHADNGDHIERFSIERAHDKYIGVYQHGSGLTVVESSDLTAWTSPRPLQQKGAWDMSGKFHFAFGGVLLVYEANIRGVGASVAVRFYGSVDDFLSASAFEREFVAPRTLAAECEGTPNIIDIAGENLDSSTITLGMHLYKGGKNMQALAVLRDFKHWHATPSHLVNHFLSRAFSGKSYQRVTFEWKGRRWWVLEAEARSDGWTVFLGDGLGFVPVNINTPGHSASFDSPFIAAIGPGHFVSTISVRAEGSAGGEAGELLWTFRPAGYGEEATTGGATTTSTTTSDYYDYYQPGELDFTE